MLPGQALEEGTVPSAAVDPSPEEEMERAGLGPEAGQGLRAGPLEELEGRQADRADLSVAHRPLQGPALRRVAPRADHRPSRQAVGPLPPARADHRWADEACRGKGRESGRKAERKTAHRLRTFIADRIRVLRRERARLGALTNYSRVGGPCLPIMHPGQKNCSSDSSARLQPGEGGI
jgi:hypothetical protein